eukprot:1012827-Pleurochrysis_carterae.AAC.3
MAVPAPPVRASLPLLALTSSPVYAVHPGHPLVRRCVHIRYTLRFSDPSAPWAFSATLEGATSTSVVRGQLPHEAQQRKEMLPHSHQLRLAHLGSGVVGAGAAADGVVDSAAAVAAAENATLAEQLAGSGPWLWAGTGPLGFMRGGHLVTPWGSGRWGVTRGAGAESAADDAVFADFANSEHTVGAWERFGFAARVYTHLPRPSSLPNCSFVRPPFIPSPG